MLRLKATPWVIALVLMLGGCESRDSFKVNEPKEQELFINSGLVQGRPSDQQIQGVCTPDLNRTTLSCDVYNGLPNMTLSEVTLAVAWGPYNDTDRRLFRQRVSIPSLTTARVTIALGTQLPADWNWKVNAAKAIPTKM